VSRWSGSNWGEGVPVGRWHALIRSSARGLAAGDSLTQQPACLGPFTARELAVVVGIELIEDWRRHLGAITLAALMPAVGLLHVLTVVLMTLAEHVLSGLPLRLGEGAIPVLIEALENAGVQVLASLGVVGEQCGALGLRELTIVIGIVDKAEEVPPAVHHPGVVCLSAPVGVVDVVLFVTAELTAAVRVIAIKQLLEEPVCIAVAEQPRLIDLARSAIGLGGPGPEGCGLLFTRGRAQQELLLACEGGIAAADEQCEGEQAGGCSVHLDSGGWLMVGLSARTTACQARY
jgi:hypothetical protein